MRSCACGKRYEPGDRVCLACGRPRSDGDAAPVLYGPTPAAAPRPRPTPAAFAAPGLAVLEPGVREFRLDGAGDGGSVEADGDGGGNRAATEGTLGAHDRNGNGNGDGDGAGEGAGSGEVDLQVGRRAAGRRGVLGRRGVVGRRRAVVVTAVVASAAVVLASVVDGGRSPTAVLLGPGVERPIPKAIAQQPSLRWRASGLARSDEGANGGTGALIATDAERAYAVPADGANNVHAVGLESGLVEWTVALGESARYIDTIADRHLVVVGKAAGGISTLRAIDGAELWSSEAQFAYEPWPGGPLVTATSIGTGGFRLRVVAPDTGEERWAADAPSAWWAAREGLVVSTCTDVGVRRWSDGAVNWTTQIGDQCASRGNDLQVAAGNIVLGSDDEWRGIDLDTGAAVWRRQRDRDRESLEALDGRRVRLADRLSSGTEREPVLDGATGELTGAEIDGRLRVVHARLGGTEQLYAVDGSSMRLLDPATFAVGATSIPIAGSLAALFGDGALADGQTYDLAYVGGTSTLIAYATADGASRWSIDTGTATQLLSIGPVVLLRDGRDLVAYG